MLTSIRSLLLLFSFLMLGSAGEVLARDTNVSSQAHRVIQAFFDSSETPDFDFSMVLISLADVFTSE